MEVCSPKTVPSLLILCLQRRDMPELPEHPRYHQHILSLTTRSSPALIHIYNRVRCCLEVPPSMQAMLSLVNKGQR